MGCQAAAKNRGSIKVVAKESLQDQIISVSQDYLGPASERFITRQAATHLKKDLADITKADLIKLIDWIKLSFALLTKDGELVDEYAARLLKIAQSKPSM